MPEQKKLILEIEFEQDLHPCDSTLIDRCKNLFIRIFKKVVGGSVYIKCDVQGKTTQLPSMVVIENDRPIINLNGIQSRWPNSPQLELIVKSAQFVLDFLDDELLNTYTLADKLHLSKASFYRRLKSATGLSVKDFIKVLKMHAAYELLNQKRYTVSEVAWRCGYSSVRHFSKLFVEVYNVLPSKLISQQ